MADGKRKELPDAAQKEVPVPDKGTRRKKLPSPETEKKPVPKTGKPENVVVIGGREIEIKPTKLKYHRNNTAFFYKIVESVPLPEIMAMPAGTFGDDRDGDKALMDWLIAVTDDPDLIVENYDELDADVIEKLLEIFRRVNRVTEKEERQKNAMSQAAKE